LPSDPGHAHWKRDFNEKSTGLFGFVLNGSENDAESFIDALQFFGIGYSWGGFESLVVIADLKHARTTRPWQDGPIIRLQIGLEDVDDLISDLDQAFRSLASSS
jgi:cystathionine beta-lyase